MVLTSISPIGCSDTAGRPTSTQRFTLIRVNGLLVIFKRLSAVVPKTEVRSQMPRALPIPPPPSPLPPISSCKLSAEFDCQSQTVEPMTSLNQIEEVMMEYTSSFKYPLWRIAPMVAPGRLTCCSTLSRGSASARSSAVSPVSSLHSSVSSNVSGFTRHL
ncbi:hypothetical protein EYF80_022984 [Liparis tanakae]|uniref:Uncharacterized protein n=1 Tax=Liparis tanakae TaxID=230148 RepID=A0A4Z2HPN9_9TELE|nr:hypothetical protein EYF80_022984 [Liparis tanakae]